MSQLAVSIDFGACCFLQNEEDEKCIKGIIQYEYNHGNQAERNGDETRSSLRGRITALLWSILTSFTKIQYTEYTHNDTFSSNKTHFKKLEETQILQGLQGKEIRLLHHKFRKNHQHSVSPGSAIPAFM